MKNRSSDQTGARVENKVGRKKVRGNDGEEAGGWVC